ncbi:MAG: hypothetical protein WA919_06765 [Coleofasciculaceae cyanobacterium]
MSKRVSVVLSDNVAENLEQLASKERRSQSQMGAILIEEALAARNASEETQAPLPEEKSLESH